MKRKVPFTWFLCALAAAFFIAFLVSLLLPGCSAPAWKKTASTIELTGGRYEGDGDLVEGDVIMVGFHPLAWLYMPEAEPTPVYEVPAPVYVPGAQSDPEPAHAHTGGEDGPWYKDRAVRDWIERLLLLIVGAGGLLGGQRLAKRRTATKENNGSTEK